MKLSRVALHSAVASLALLAFNSQAYADGVFGRTSVGTNSSSGMSADFKRGSKFTLTEPAVTNLICAYLDGHGGGSGSQSFRFALYRDNNGVPGAKVVESPSQGRFAGMPARWLCEGVAPMPLSPGAYWLMIHSSGNPGVLRYYSDGPAGWFGNADIWADGAADSFGNGNAGAGTMSIYAAYLEGYEVFGRTTVGTTRSSAMLNDYKRASSFTLTGTGVLRTGAFYMDGLGGATGQSHIFAGVYRDSNGVPGALVARGHVAPVFSGEPGLWRRTGFDWAKLTPGKYWLALKTIGASGVSRYAMDGTGNWYGGPTSGDNLPDPFGPGFAGNGTISGFVGYQPGTFTTGRFGRTSVAAPLQWLKADYMRGSKFHMQTSKEAAITALYAYLDGNGGAPGSQALSMVLYHVLPDDVAPNPVSVVESSTVIIAARRPPGWVRFPVPARIIETGDYWIMIHSGGTAGVVRMYGDGAGNLRARTDTFDDGADDELDGGSAAGGTLSVYAEYEEFQPQ